MSLPRFSVSLFPVDGAQYKHTLYLLCDVYLFAVQEKDALGIPWGMSIQPFGVASTASSNAIANADDASNSESTVAATTATNAAAAAVHALTNSDALRRITNCLHFFLY